MLSTREVERHFNQLDPVRMDILLELRSLVAGVAPDITERIDRRGLTYYDPQRGGPVSAGLCQIWIEPDHLRLAFIHGAFLPDPQRLLKGTRLAKRYVRIYSYAHAPWDDLRELIAASRAFNPYTQQFDRHERESSA